MKGMVSEMTRHPSHWFVHYKPSVKGCSHSQPVRASPSWCMISWVLQETKSPYGWLPGTSTSYQLCHISVNNSYATLPQTALDLTLRDSVPCSVPSPSAPVGGLPEETWVGHLYAFSFIDCWGPACTPYSFFSTWLGIGKYREFLVLKVLSQS